MLAISRSVEYFSQYLYGRLFKICTDYRPKMNLNSKRGNFLFKKKGNFRYLTYKLKKSSEISS